MKRALDEAETADPEPSELTVRIGIHTGPVVFGPVADSLAMDYTVIGDTANVAARLQQATEPGTILVSDETCRLAQGYARFDLSRSGRSSSKARPSRSRLIVCSRSPIAAWGCASRHRRAPRCLSIARASSRSGGTRSYAGVPFTD